MYQILVVIISDGPSPQQIKTEVLEFETLASAARSSETLNRAKLVNCSVQAIPLF